MTKILQINATTARKTLFTLIDQVVNGDIKVILSKEGTSEKVVLQKLSTNYEIQSTSKQLSIVRDTEGSLKTSGYKANEFELAKKEFIKRYKEKHVIK